MHTHQHTHLCMVQEHGIWAMCKVFNSWYQAWMYICWDAFSLPGQTHGKMYTQGGVWSAESIILLTYCCQIVEEMLAIWAKEISKELFHTKEIYLRPVCVLLDIANCLSEWFLGPQNGPWDLEGGQSIGYGALQTTFWNDIFWFEEPFCEKHWTWTSHG